ncbi:MULTISPECIES: hypothetical protein [unclassified Xanthomonas]|uniref:hypothetical protein n=1 Tax=unclassified Xanthomonas TaxID=2643310 RepID=UPI0025E3295E|nr:hypothetical protein [uncultured Xanthomonas sp.]
MEGHRLNRSAPATDGLLKARLSLGHIISDTDPLSAQDYELIGTFIQTYCIADLESRRVVNCLTHIRLGEPTAFALKLIEKDVLDHLVASADSCTWNIDLAKGILKAAEIFVQHRQIRHIFAHWAGRRVPGHDAFIFFTASLDKQKTPVDATFFEKSDDANIKYALMPISNLVEEQKKLKGHAQYLATIAAELESKAPQIAEQFAQDIATGKLQLRPYRVSGGRT